jgi:hypothetical protein
VKRGVLFCLHALQLNAVSEEEVAGSEESEIRRLKVYECIFY